MATFGSGHQPGGAWQRAMTLQWFNRIAAVLEAGTHVLFEGQMRIAFIQEALALFDIQTARVILVDCDDQTRAARLIHDRRQPGLASTSMMQWAYHLREEAEKAGYEILETGAVSLVESVNRVASYLT